MKRIIGLFVVSMCLAISASAQVPAEHLEEHGRGIIEDYSDMKPIDEIEFMWLSPKARLKDAKFEVKPFENLTKLHDARMIEAFDEAFEKTLAKVASRDKGAQVLTIEGAVYWAQRASRGKMWIPIVGGHVAQAGVGVELIVRNKKGEVVAKVRHSGREGDQLQDAAYELIDDFAAFVEAH